MKARLCNPKGHSGGDSTTIPIIGCKGRDIDDASGFLRHHKGQYGSCTQERTREVYLQHGLPPFQGWFGYGIEECYPGVVDDNVNVTESRQS